MPVCFQVWIVLFVSDLVLYRYLMCKSMELFVPGPREWGWVHVTKFLRTDSSRHWQTTAQRERTALMAQHPAHPFSVPFLHVTAKHNKLQHMLMRCDLSLGEVCKSEMSLYLSLSCFWEAGMIDSMIKRGFGGTTTSKSLALRGGWDLANCLLAWWWLNVSLSGFFILLCHCGCLCSSTPPSYICFPPSSLIFTISIFKPH